MQEAIEQYKLQEKKQFEKIGKLAFLGETYFHELKEVVKIKKKLRELENNHHKKKKDTHKSSTRDKNTPLYTNTITVRKIP